MFNFTKIILSLVLAISLLNVSGFTTYATEVAGDEDIEEIVETNEENLDENEEKADEEVAEDEEVDEATSQDLEATEEAEVNEIVTYTATASGVKVTVEASSNALPENAELVATLFDENSNEYNEASNAIDLDDDLNMAALDISFMVNGEEVEPTEEVKVTIDASAIIPNDADESTIEVQHLEESGSSVIPELVADAQNASAGTISDAVAEFTVESFSTFTITWSTSSTGGGPGEQQSSSLSITATTYLVDTSTTIGSGSSTISVTSGNSVALTSSNSALDISGYTLTSATVYGKNTSYANARSITVTISGNGNNKSYSIDVVYIDNGESNTATFTSTSNLSISLYYTPAPGIDLSASNNTVTSTLLSKDYFTYSDIVWSSSNNAATVTGNDDGTATVTWAAGTIAGTTTIITVTATATGSKSPVEGTTKTVSDTIKLTYASDASITITNSSGDSATDNYVLTASTDTKYTYGNITWTTDNDNATLSTNSGSSTTVTWASGLTAGDTVTVTATATTTDGSVVVVDSYTLTYGLEPVTIKVNSGNSSVNGATVELYDASGNLVASGTTSNGSVTLYVIPETYTAKAYYSVTTTQNNQSTTTTYTGETTNVTVSANSTNTATVSVSSGSSVDHIDIALKATATITLNGEKLTETITLTDDDFNGTNDTTWSVTTDTGDTYIITDFEAGASESSSGASQIRFDGVFPIGTESKPVTYTFTFTRTVTFTANDGTTYDVEMTFSASFSYWDNNNECPGLGNNWSTNKEWSANAGMDFTLSAEATSNTMTIYKFVEDTANNLLDASGTTYVFDLYKFNSTTNEYELYKTLTLNPSTSGAAMNTFQLEDGKYKLVESSYSDSVTVTTSTSSDTYIYDSTDIKDIEYDSNGEQKVDATYNNTTSLEFDVSGEAIIFYVTNYYEGDTTSINLTKIWNDGNSTTRPDSITVDVYQNDGETLYDKYTITSTTDGVTVNSDGSWSYTISGLPKYDSSDKEYTYTIKEVTVDGYSSNIVANSDGSYTITNTELTSIGITKVWNNGDATTPTSISVEVYQNNNETPYDTYTITSTTDGVTVNSDGSWSYTITDLPKYDDYGEEYTYTIKELSVDGYDSKIIKNSNGSYTITNTELTSIGITKVWNDGNSSTRPTSITVNVYQNNNETPYGTYIITSTTDGVTVNSDGSWTYTIENLPKYDDSGEAYTYSIGEDSIDEYVTSITGNASTGYTITNTAVTEITVTKIWDDNDNVNSTRPDSITLEVLANGATIPAKVTINENSDGVTVNSDGSWSYTFSDLPLYDANGLITYTVRELEGNAVASTILGNNGSTYSVIYDDDTYTVTNKLEAGDLSISKTL
ncbi:MAG: Cna B-type domain-containing protein, partial [Erysipelotrichaceae bacterium]|nr:Cna B-type domain-containing protein [Erysipelotrichaceae bacterium]